MSDIKEFIKTNCICPICRDITIDPVSPVCGHNMCYTCYKNLSQTTSTRKCPICKKDFPKVDLCVNIILRDILQTFAGKKYNNIVKRQIRLEEQRAIVDEYIESNRAKTIINMIESYLFFNNAEENENAAAVSSENRIAMKYDDILAHFSTYEKEEIDLLLAAEIAGSAALCHGDILINPDCLEEFIASLDSSQISTALMIFISDLLLNESPIHMKRVFGELKNKIKKPGFTFANQGKTKTPFDYLSIFFVSSHKTDRPRTRRDYKRRETLIRKLTHFITLEKICNKMSSNEANTNKIDLNQLTDEIKSLKCTCEICSNKLKECVKTATKHNLLLEWQDKREIEET